MTKAFVSTPRGKHIAVLNEFWLQSAVGSVVQVRFAGCQRHAVTHNPGGDVQDNQDEAVFIQFNFEPTGWPSAVLATACRVTFVLANSRRERNAEEPRRGTLTELHGRECDEKHKRRLILSSNTERIKIMAVNWIKWDGWRILAIGSELLWCEPLPPSLISVIRPHRSPPPLSPPPNLSAKPRRMEVEQQQSRQSALLHTPMLAVVAAYYVTNKDSLMSSRSYC